ncbi:MAG: hypothetical protein IJW96_05385 [Clostridia bacterium]|nr:hypothetical protein [Clostridia bacterium]
MKRIDFSRKRLGWIADKYYNEGDYVSALKFAYRELEMYGGNGDVFARLADIYEGMNLQGMAINYWFQFLHIADEEELPDIYEGLAVNYLALGQEMQAAFYYNRLIDVDDEIPEETKLDIAEAFSDSKKNKFRFVYPPRLADYTEEFNWGSRALKAGDCKRAVEFFSKIEKGSKQYLQGKELQAIAYMLDGNTEQAKQACLEILEEVPNDVRALATLSAVYGEQGLQEQSRAIAERLAEMHTEDTDELFKIATVCCENGLDQEAFKRFELLDQKTPYDGRVLYFKGVSAFKSGFTKTAVDAFEKLITIYPDAEVARYYWKALREYQDGGPMPTLTYFYHLPQEEREARCVNLMHINKCNQQDAQLFGFLALQDRYFEWCFDEMDGNDQDLQYLGLITAVHVGADSFLQDVLLDYEVADVLKLEVLRMLLERNEENQFGLVLYNIYRKIFLPRISIGRKRRKKFVQAYAKVASKFIILKETYGEVIRLATEKLYRALEGYNALDLVDSVDDCACAIFLLTGIKELGNDPNRIASVFEANLAKVQVLLTEALSSDYGMKG